MLNDKALSAWSINQCRFIFYKCYHSILSNCQSKLFSSILLAYRTIGETWDIFLDGWNDINSTDPDN